MQKFLDNSGFAYFVNKLKAYVDKKSKVEIGETLTEADGVLSVTTPVKGVISQEDFDRLGEDEKKHGMYVIPGDGGGGSPGGSCSNVNILDNWYFANPINQYGAVSYTSATRSNGYTIDRWKLLSGSLTVGSDGVTLDGTFVQILENPLPDGKTTATVLTDTGPIDAQYDNSSRTFTVTATGRKLIAAKLELGSTQTLCHKEDEVWVLNDPPPNPAEELAKCQRYQIVLRPYSNSTFGRVAIGFGIYNKNEVIALVPLPVSLCKIPSFSYSGNYELWDGILLSERIVVNTIKLDRVTTNAATLSVRTSTQVINPGMPYSLEDASDKNAFILLDANL